MAKLTKKSFINMSPADIAKMKNPELRQLLRGARQLFSAQESKFKKYENTVWSPALEKMQATYENNGKMASSRMNRSQMQFEVYRIQEFFQAKTSTIPGARQVAIEQDKAIFGVDEKGKPKQRMTLEQRTNFWAAYNEFKAIEKEYYVRNIGSNVIQQYLGQMMIEVAKAKGDDFLFDASSFGELKRRLEVHKERVNRSEYQYGDNEVFTGKWTY